MTIKEFQVQKALGLIDPIECRRTFGGWKYTCECDQVVGRLIEVRPVYMISGVCTTSCNSHYLCEVDVQDE